MGCEVSHEHDDMVRSLGCGEHIEDHDGAAVAFSSTPRAIKQVPRSFSLVKGPSTGVLTIIVTRLHFTSTEIS